MTPKQARFVKEYLIDLNATQAAIRAGYAPANANVEGSRLLANANIRDAIASAQAARCQRLEITADRVVQEYARVAFANMGDYLTFGPDGPVVRDLATLTPGQCAAIREVAQAHTGSGNGVRIRLHDKLAALAALARHLGLNAPERLASKYTRADQISPLEAGEAARLIAFALAKAGTEQPQRPNPITH